MGSTYDYVPTRLTKAFREAQSDEKFQGWLKMQEAAMEIEFPIYDVPEIRESMFTKDSLAVVEAKLIELYPNERAAWSGEENIHRTMRFVYYIGETFRRAFEGTWAALSPRDPKVHKNVLRPAIDLPYEEAFTQPLDLVGIALNRRTSREITRVYGYAEEDYNEWVESGRPKREFQGTLREE